MSDTARPGRFVGREHEVALFERVLADSTPHRGLYLHGPGGVGKTVLLHHLVRRCSAHGLEVASLDAARLGCSREAVLDGLVRSCGLEDRDALSEALTTRAAVIALDSLEFLGPLEDWLVGGLIADLPPQTLFLLAGRRLLGPKARGRLSWLTSIRPVGVRSFARGDSDSFLATMNVPDGLHAGLYELTTGHPLALALVGEVAREHESLAAEQTESLTLDNFPNVVPELLAYWIRDLPTSGSFREALHACALSVATTQDMLAEALQTSEDDAVQAYDWLQGRSFVETTPDGLVPHQLVRDALAADLRWRDPPGYLDLLRRLALYHARSMRSASEREASRAVTEFIYLVHAPAGWSGFMERNAHILADPVPATDADWDDVELITERFEGSESVRLLRHWRSHGATCFVLRDEAGVSGFTLELRLDEASDDAVAADPVAAAVRQTLDDQGLSPRTPVLFHRLWAARDTYQAVSAVQTRLGLLYFTNLVTTPDLAMGAYCVRYSERWDTIVEQTPIERLCGGCLVGGTRYDVMCDDLRGIDPAGWAIRHVPMALGDVEKPALTPLVVALPREAFSTWVSKALDDLEHPLRLQQNPLARSRFVESIVGPDADLPRRARALAETIRDHRASLGPSVDRLTAALWQLDGGELTPPAGQAPAARQEKASLRHDGETWSITFRGQLFTVKDTKGWRYLDYLLRHPHRPVLALDLVAGLADGQTANSRAPETPLLDEQALQAYRERLDDLRAEHAEASSNNDLGRVEALAAEIDALEESLSSAIGLGGRSRRFSSEAERARVSVTMAIRTAQKNIERASESLAQHIANCVKTGRTCCYEPEPGREIVWE